MFKVFLIIIVIILSAHTVFATPSKYGDSGLINVPMAETHQSGSICMGLWADQANVNGKSFLQVPVSITLGLGAALEAFGSYPNLLFNGDESFSDREFSSIGMKMRVWGKRSSAFKVAIDGQFRQSVSDVPEDDGLVDRQGRIIASLKLSKVGLHLSGGTLSPDSSRSIKQEKQQIYGAGLEVFPFARVRIMAEIFGSSEVIKGEPAPQEANLGFQYYVSPHLALSISYAQGLSDSSPDNRLTVGLFACQGTGIYIKPIRRIIEAPVVEEKIEVNPEDANKLKIKTLMPRRLKSRKMNKNLKSKSAGPSSEMMVEVGSEGSEVTLSASDRLQLKSVKKGIGASALAVAGSAQATSAPNLPSTSALSTVTPSVPVGAANVAITVQPGTAATAITSVPTIVGAGAVMTNVVTAPQATTTAMSNVSPEKAAETSILSSLSAPSIPSLPSVGIVPPVSGAFASAALPSTIASGAKGVVAQGNLGKTAVQNAPQPKHVASSEPIKAVVQNRFRMSSSVFSGNGWELTEEGKQVLHQIAEELKANKNWTFLRIDGFTDNVGSAAYNKNLSLKQSTSAANYLITKEGIDPNRLFIKGNGQVNPISSNGSAEGRSANRRVEFLLLSPKGSVP